MKSARPKFEQRKVLLRAELQRDAVLALVRNLPLDPVRPLEVIVREEVKARKLDQNGYYWLRLTEIAEQAWFKGRQFSKEVWHEYARQNLMPDTITTKDGEVRSKWVESPDGRPVVISTALLERKCFAEYTEAVEAFGAGLGVQFSANPNDLQRAA